MKKVCYKVSLCKNCQRQSCKPLIGLTIRAKMIGGDVPFCVKIWQKISINTNRKSTTRFPMSLT